MTVEDSWERRRSDAAPVANHSRSTPHSSFFAFSGLEERTRAFVTQRPAAAALAALCLGYVVGRIVLRR